MKQAAVITLLLTIMVHQVVYGETTKQKKEPKAISFLLFIPGAQQLKSKKYVKGTLLLGSFLGAMAGTLVYNKKGNDWYDKYSSSTMVDDIIYFRQQTEKNLKNRNICIGGAIFVWLIHVVDLKFFKSDQIGVKSHVGKDKFNFGFYYSF